MHNIIGRKSHSLRCACGTFYHLMNYTEAIEFTSTHSLWCYCWYLDVLGIVLYVQSKAVYCLFCITAMKNLNLFKHKGGGVG